MIKFICLFLPSLVSTELEEKLLKIKKSTIREYWVKSGIYCLLNNIVSITILTIILHVTYDIETSITLYPGVAVKYAVISTAVAVFLALAKVVLVKNFEVKLNEKNN